MIIDSIFWYVIGAFSAVVLVRGAEVIIRALLNKLDRRR